MPASERDADVASATNLSQPLTTAAIRKVGRPSARKPLLQLGSTRRTAQIDKGATATPNVPQIAKGIHIANGIEGAAQAGGTARTIQLEQSVRVTSRANALRMITVAFD